MYRKQDFKKLDLLGSGKKHTKIYKVQHVGNGKIYALKEIEAKNLEKLNEYKEEAVQLSKVQTHPNIIKFYGYYFCETMYNTFRLGLVTEYMDHNLNLENVYRKKKKAGQIWKESELVTFVFSLISTCSFLQQRGICHRDIKPANLFILPNNETKLIDFGESKDYVFDFNDENKNTYTMATIRGTPQYLSPILWKAHVVEGSSRYAQHNMYKSDVFSAGLVVYQMAALREVTGFNNKTASTDGEVLIRQCLQELEKTYSPQFISIIALMLIFEESARPSFHEIEHIFMDHETRENETLNQRASITSTKSPEDNLSKSTIINEYIRYYNRHYSTLTKRHSNQKINENAETLQNFTSKSLKNSLNSSMAGNQRMVQSMSDNPAFFNYPHTNSRSNGTATPIPKESEQLQSQQLGIPSKLSQHAEVKDTRSVYWFEFGGKSIGKFSVSKGKWKYFMALNEESEFPMHFTVLYIPTLKCYYLLGGPPEDCFRVFKSEKEAMTRENGMLRPRNFFPAVYSQNKVYVFGGYDDAQKRQSRSCECFDISKGEWAPVADMNQDRSQAAACLAGPNFIYIFGGYNKSKGTLHTIERYNILENRFDLLDVTLKDPLRRANCISVAEGHLLIMGGMKRHSKASQSVYKFDIQHNELQNWENLEKGGVLELEILADAEGYLHLFLEDAFGTSPPTHIHYFYDTKASKYVTENHD